MKRRPRISCEACREFEGLDRWFDWLSQNGTRKEVTVAAVVRAAGCELRGRGGRKRRLLERHKVEPLGHAPQKTHDVGFLRHLRDRTEEWFEHLWQYDRVRVREHLESPGVPDWMRQLGAGAFAIPQKQRSQRRSRDRAVRQALANRLGKSERTIYGWLRDAEMLERAEHIGWHRIIPQRVSLAAQLNREAYAAEYAYQVYVSELREGRFDRLGDTCDAERGEPCAQYQAEGCCGHILPAPIINRRFGDYDKAEWPEREARANRYRRIEGGEWYGPPRLD